MSVDARGSNGNNCVASHEDNETHQSEGPAA